MPDERSSSLLALEDDVTMVTTASQNAHADFHPDGCHGLQDMRIIEAIHETGESGERVTLE